MSSISANQPQLFDPESLHDVNVVRNIDGRDVLTTYGSEGSYMDVAERAKYLLTALVSMSERNRRDGFSLAPYRWNTETVVDGASRNRNAYHQQLKRSFWRAAGFYAMRGANFMPDRQINPRSQQMWRDFNKKFGHPKDVLERRKYKKILAKQIGNPQKVNYITRRALARKAFE